jgi:HlyD family secretion protein
MLNQFVEHAPFYASSRPAQSESAWTGWEIFVTCGARLLSELCQTSSKKFMAENRNGGWLKWTIIFVGGIVVIAAGIWFFFIRDQGEAPQYQTVEIARGNVTNVVTATGTLNPVVNVTVGSQVSGIINKLNVDFNSIVKSNEIIAEIDPSTYHAAVEQATADLANAKANLELQQAEEERSADLFTNKLISGSDYDTAIATLHEAEATVQIKQASLDNANANLGYCKIRSPVDGIVISRAIDLGQTVASSFNTPTLFQIANDLTKMQIDSSVAEADVGGVVEGQEVDFTVDAYPYRTFHGTVTQVRNSPTTVNNVVTYDCVIGVTNADYKLKPGMTANVSIIIAQHEGVLKIPNGALRFRPPETAMIETQTNSPATTQTNLAVAGNGQRGGFGQGGGRFGGGQGRGGSGGGRGQGPRQIRTVYILTTDANGKSKLQPARIRVGISDGIYTEVLDGLKEGDNVVIGAISETSAAPTGNPFGGGGFRRF